MSPISTDTSAAGVSSVLQDVIRERAGAAIREIRPAGRDEFTITYDLVLQDERPLILRIPNPNTGASMLESEIATMSYVADRTSIPAPKVVAFNFEKNSVGGAYALVEKPTGISLDAVFATLSHFQQNLIVAQAARYMLELFHHHFDAIGSLVPNHGEGYRVGPIVQRSFCLDGRSRLDLDRGPFKSAKTYYLACAQRELDCSRVLFVQDASPNYQRDLEDGRLQVERIAGLFGDLVRQCEGLDGDDPEMAPFSLDIHEFGLKDFVVDPVQPTKIVAINRWQFVSTRPLWCCARFPVWLHHSLSGGSDVSRLAAIFRGEVARVDGPNSTFLRALDSEGTRCTLDDLSEYDAFKDGFLLLPALENILATLPGHEDVAGLTALLDPSTLPGRVARINLLTRGSNAMFLAMTPPHSPKTVKMGPVQDSQQLDSEVVV